MVDSNYFSPSQVQLFINGYHVDDACCIQWNVVDNKRPLFGYNDQDWRRVAKGRSYVEGSLDIHFRYHGYLTNVIAASEVDKDKFPETIRELGLVKKAQNAKQYLDLYEDIDDPVTKGEFIRQNFQAALTYGNRPDPGDKALGQAVQNRLAGQSKALFDQLKNRYWHQDTPRRDLNLSANERPGRVINNPKFKEGFNIVVRFGELHSMEDRNTTLLLEQVHIVSGGTRISSDVPEGGAPVRERYQFIARSIHPYR